ncbi:MAG TPA: response regulator transcription factor [Syntrophorhabdales bacterium]|nr:response regulator transcription factor [Syntrophorhabdales bacterium]
MKILIHLGNHLIAEAISQLLVRNGYESVITSSNSRSTNFKPDTVMVDIQTLDQQFLSQFPDAKVFLIDTGLEKERIIAALLSYKIHGVLSPRTELELFKKALTVVSQGQIWVDNSTVVAFLHESGTLSKSGRIGSITLREREIIDYVCQGYSNNEIADALALSRHTIKAHLNRIFKKLNVNGRRKLISLALNNHQLGGTQKSVAR